MKWEPADVAAIVIIAGCIGLLACGINGEVKGILAVAGGWAFGKGYITVKPPGGNKP